MSQYADEDIKYYKGVLFLLQLLHLNTVRHTVEGENKYFLLEFLCNGANWQI